VSTRKGATRKNLSIFLKVDCEVASFGLPEEMAAKLEGRLMGTSARRRIVAEACYDDSDSECITVAAARLTVTESAPLRANNAPPCHSAMSPQTLLCYPSSL
jgi:hypothetical protein